MQVRLRQALKKVAPHIGIPVYSSTFFKAFLNSIWGIRFLSPAGLFDRPEFLTKKLYAMKTATQKLTLGHLVMTRTVAFETNKSNALYRFILKSVNRHKSGDWGDTNHHDSEMNDYAIKNGERILSVYLLPKHIRIDEQSKIWIITEGDRSVTTVLFPSDY